MKSPNDTNQSGLPTDKKNRPLMELSASVSEAVVDVAMEGDLFASIPLVGTAIQALNAIDSVRDRLFASKILKFAAASHGLSDAERKVMQAHLKSADDVSKVGEVLLLTLDRITDLDKAQLLGEIFVRYAKGELTSASLRRIARAFDKAFFDDLQEFICAHPLELNGPLIPVLRGLTDSGLVYADSPGTIGGGGMQFSVSALGKELRELFKSKQRAEPKNLVNIEI